MTTVIYKDGVFYADRLVTQGNGVLGQTRKIHIVSPGIVVGFSGNLDASLPFLAAMRGESVAHEDFKDSDYSALVWNENGELRGYHRSMKYYDTTESEYHAIGSGAVYAIGAMDAGASGLEALAIAARRDVWTGGGFDIYNVKNGVWDYV